jgi:hypothetical protein
MIAHRWATTGKWGSDVLPICVKQKLVEFLSACLSRTAGSYCVEDGLGDSMAAPARRVVILPTGMQRLQVRASRPIEDQLSVEDQNISSDVDGDGLIAAAVEGPGAPCRYLYNTVLNPAPCTYMAS